MTFHEQKISGVYIVKPEPFHDSRGSFHRHFCVESFRDAGLDFQIAQTNFTINTHKHTLRGFHFRKPEYGESKLFTCVQGGFFNVVLDLREDSPTYKQSFTLELTWANGLGLYLPHGCANGFLTLDDNTVGHYYHSSIYTPGADAGVRYNDPAFDLTWPCEPSVISEKDLSYPDFEG